MIVKPHPVQRLESIDEVGALLVGDFINAKLPDGFEGEICLIGDNPHYGPSFARMTKNGDGNYVKVYERPKVGKIRDGKMIVSEANHKDIKKTSPDYYWLKLMLTKCKVPSFWEYL
jgi:hypothetical protein